MAHPGAVVADAPRVDSGSRRALYLIVVAVAAIVYLGCIVSPPSLMDDVDAVQAQIARTMLQSGDWVTARLDGVAYLEKAPLVYWAIAVAYRIFGVHDWAARVPIALSAIALCWLTAAFGAWAFDRRAGLYAGLCMATCVGLFLFTRILIPDVMLTLMVALALWALLRALDEEERHPRLWAAAMAAAIGAGLLLKSLIGALFPLAAGVVYLAVSRQLFSARTWKRLRPVTGAAIVLAVAVPWHVLAAIRNPPVFAWTLNSGPGQYHGFLWFFFVNEQLLRFLNLRYPRDYNTVPRVYFWLLHFAWLFPWSVYLPAAATLPFEPIDRAGRARLLALCWIGFVLVFFTFSTTQEYYSMPCYPAFALLLGSAMAADGAWIRRGTRALTVVAAGVGVVLTVVLLRVWNLPAPGGIAAALSRNPDAYTLALGHMEDLTLRSFAYLRLPLGLAAAACLIGAAGTFRAPVRRAVLSATLMMVLFIHAARLAMVTFDPYLSSRPIANALLKGPPGTLIVDHHYYTFSSVFFYTGEPALLLNGKYQNLEYGAAAPDAPPVFISDEDFVMRWSGPARYYVVAAADNVDRLRHLAGAAPFDIVATSGDNSLATNHPLPAQ